MSTVVLQIGQCGNQIGREFFSRVPSSTANGECRCPYMRLDGKLRSVNVDTEPKVVKHLCRNKSYTTNNVINGCTGSGSNWALGYHGVKGNNHEGLVEATVEAVRQEVEKCDQYCGTVLFHSLAGGTGSGLSSRLCVELRDAYPLHYLMSCCVAPCQFGESPLQHYNSLLALAYVQRYTDAVILLRNDDILKAAAANSDAGLVKSQKSTKSQKSVGLSEVNSHIADCLAGLLMPTDTLNTACKHTTGREPWELVSSLAPIPTVKFLHTTHVSTRSYSWEALLNKLLSELPQRDVNGKHYSSLAGVLVARGGDPSIYNTVDHNTNKILSTFGCVSWNPFPLNFWTAKRSLYSTKPRTSITSAVNTSYVLGYLDNVVNKAKVMRDSGAYLHWYRRHAADIDSELENSFEEIASVIDSYNEYVS